MSPKSSVDDLLKPPATAQKQPSSGPAVSLPIFAVPLSPRLRAEVKARIFADLALTVKLGGSLTSCAQAMGSDHQPSLQRRPILVRLGRAFFLAPTLLLKVYQVLILLVTPLLVMMWHAVGSVRFFDPEPIIRRIGAQLHRQLNKGKSLADALESCLGVFDAAESEMVRSATRTGRLETVLTSLSHRQMLPWKQQSYSPTGLLLAMSFFFVLLINFLQLFILPRYHDIGEGLAPGMNLAAQYGLRYFEAGGLSLAAFGVAVAIALASNQYGSSRNWGATLALFSIWPVVFSVIIFLLGSAKPTGHTPPEMRRVLFSIIPGFVLLFAWRWLESIHTRNTSFLMRWFLETLYSAPIISRLIDREQAELNMMRLVEAGIAGGLESEEISDSLIRGAHPALSAPLDQARVLSASGQPFIQALLNSGALTGRPAIRMGGLDFSPDLAARLHLAIEELEYLRSLEELRRQEQIKFVGYVTLGLLVGTYLYGVYSILSILPFFADTDPGRLLP